MSVRGVFVDANGSLADIFERQNKRDARRQLAA
jgi:hypothetical protein